MYSRIVLFGPADWIRAKTKILIATDNRQQCYQSPLPLKTHLDYFVFMFTDFFLNILSFIQRISLHKWPETRSHAFQRTPRNAYFFLFSFSPSITISIFSSTCTPRTRQPMTKSFPYRFSTIEARGLSTQDSCSYRSQMASRMIQFEKFLPVQITIKPPEPRYKNTSVLISCPNDHLNDILRLFTDRMSFCEGKNGKTPETTRGFFKAETRLIGAKDVVLASTRWG